MAGGLEMAGFCTITTSVTASFQAAFVSGGDISGYGGDHRFEYPMTATELQSERKNFFKRALTKADKHLIFST